MNRLAIFLLLLSPIFIHAQKRLELVHDNAFAFYDYNEKAFCVLDDSTFLWKYNQHAVKWEKTPIQLSIEMPFEQFLADFIPMSEKGTPVYFVYSGCGVVYTLKNKAIRRHDHSFFHMNQFDGAFFMDEGEPRIYGGYGLFTSKNIITRYDTIEREWFLIYSNYNQAPVGVKNIIQKNKHDYYVYDGFKGVSLHYKKFNEVWQFNIPTKKWKKIGKINQSILGKQLEFNNERLQIQNHMYTCFQNMIVTYDFEKFKYKKYKFYSTGLYRKIINIGDLFLVFKTNSKPKSYIEIRNDLFLKQFEYEEGDIIEKEKSFFNTKYILIIAIIILCIILLILIIYVIRKNKLQSISTQLEKSLINEFNPTELQLIQLLIKNHQSGLEISFINDLVNQDQPSIDTLKKRRETLLKELRYKLAAKFNIPQEEIFIEQRMVSDKRMKLLFLNKLIVLKF